MYDHAQLFERCCMSKLQNHVRALPSSAFFLARTANCLWKASLDRVKPFLWFFPRWPRMSCNPFRRCFSAPFGEGDVVSKKLESDHVSLGQWVLNCVQGYEIEWVARPSQICTPRELVFPKAEADCLSAEIEICSRKRRYHRYVRPSTWPEICDRFMI